MNTLLDRAAMAVAGSCLLIACEGGMTGTGVGIRSNTLASVSAVHQVNAGRVECVNQLLLLEDIAVSGTVAPPKWIRGSWESNENTDYRFFMIVDNERVRFGFADNHSIGHAASDIGIHETENTASHYGYRAVIEFENGDTQIQSHRFAKGTEAGHLALELSSKDQPGGNLYLVASECTE